MIKQTDFTFVRGIGTNYKKDEILYRKCKTDPGTSYIKIIAAAKKNKNGKTIRGIIGLGDDAAQRFYSVKTLYRKWTKEKEKEDIKDIIEHPNGFIEHTKTTKLKHITEWYKKRGYRCNPMRARYSGICPISKIAFGPGAIVAYYGKYQGMCLVSEIEQYIKFVEIVSYK